MKSVQPPSVQNVRRREVVQPVFLQISPSRVQPTIVVPLSPTRNNRDKKPKNGTLGDVIREQVSPDFYKSLRPKKGTQFRQMFFVETEWCVSAGFNGITAKEPKEIPVVRIRCRPFDSEKKESSLLHTGFQLSTRVVYGKEKKYDAAATFVQMIDDRFAHQIETVISGTSSVIETVLGKFMFARLVRRDDRWIYIPLCKNQDELNYELVRIGDQMVAMDDLIQSISISELTIQIDTILVPLYRS